jgi:hypothetical protein
VELTIVVNASAGVESLKIEGLVVEKLLGFGVCRDEDLESAVEKKAVNDVSSDAAADVVGSFEKEEGDVLGVEVGGCG